jgi:replication factor C subunit 1
MVLLICVFESESVRVAPRNVVTEESFFLRPDAAQIRSRIMTVAFKEKMQIPANVVDELVTGVGSDIRQVLNMLSTWKLHNDTMDYEEGKTLYASLPTLIRAHLICIAAQRPTKSTPC